MSWMIRQSCARLAGAVDRLVDLDDAALDLRDDALVLLVQGAGQDDVGVAAVSFRKKSMATKNSSFSSMRVMNALSGSETFGLKQIDSRPLISPRSILRNIS